ncbi:MAG: hypothetical protein CL878_09885 [Dehalococcoidia bacterium]|nr:hypothetical protein [Dehalococcoidia bacterium]
MLATPYRSIRKGTQQALRPGSPRWSRIVGGFGLLTLGSAIAIAPPLLSAAALAGALVLSLMLVQPLAGVFLLGWSVPFQSLAATTLGLFRISLTEGLVLLYVAAAVLSLRRVRGLSRPLLLLPGLVLLAVLMLSILRSRHVESSIEEVIKWAEFLAVYGVTVALLRVTRWRWWVVGGLLVAAAAEAAVGLVQTLGQIGPTHFLVNGVLMRAHGTFGQPNPFAGYLALFFPIAFALWAFGDLEARLPWIRSLAGLVAVALGSALLASLSRGGLLGFAGAVLLVLVLGSRGTRRVTLALGAGALLLTILGSLALPGQVAEPALNAAIDAVNVRTVTSTPVTPENWSVLERLSQWHAGLRMFQDNYLIGIGIGNYDFYYPEFALADWPQPLGHAHNLYLNIAAEAGLLGLGAYVVLVVAVVRLGRRALRNRHDRASRALAVGILGGLTAYSIHNLFDMLFVQGVGVLLGLLLALLENSASSPESTPSQAAYRGQPDGGTPAGNRLGAAA